MSESDGLSDDLKAQLLAIRDDNNRQIEELRAEAEGRWERLYRRSAPGRQWFKDVPDSEYRFYVVTARFTADNGEIVKPGEIISPGLGYWADKSLRPILFTDGWLKPVTEWVEGWNCPHGRFWATAEAFEAHGCCELPDDIATGVDNSSSLTIRDAQIVRLWNDNRTAAQIARQLGLAVKTIENRIGTLRREHGPSVVRRR